MSAQLSNMPEVTLPTPIMETVVTQELDTNSLQERICKSVGRFVVCKFLIGYSSTFSCIANAVITPVLGSKLAQLPSVIKDSEFRSL